MMDMQKSGTRAISRTSAILTMKKSNQSGSVFENFHSC